MMSITRSPRDASTVASSSPMDVHDVPPWLSVVAHEVGAQFQRIPGSAILLRYVRSSYQNDPVRSAVELFLFLFFVRYLMAPKYSTQNKGYVKLSDEVRMAGRPPTHSLCAVRVHRR